MSYTDQNYASSSSNTITAFFDDQADAHKAVSRLVEAGIPQSSVRVIAESSPAEGAGATTSGEHKGFWASLADLFLPDDDRSVYAEGIRRGGYLVTVSGYPLSLHDKTLDILDDEGSIDLDERAEAWESEGWSRTTADRYDASASGIDTLSGSDTTRGTASTSSLEADSEDVIPVVQEELRVGKRDVNNGRVRVRSYVTETPVRENVSLRDENVEITRRPVDRPITDSENAFVDRTIEAEEHREEAVVSKDARVVEEIALRKTAEQRQETISDSVRKTEVEVEDDRTTGVRNTATGNLSRE